MNTLNKPEGVSVKERQKGGFAVPKLLKNIAGMVGIGVLSTIAPHSAKAEPVIPGESINMPSPNNAFGPKLVDTGANGSLRMVYLTSAPVSPGPDPLLQIDTKRVDLETKCDSANGDFVLTQKGFPTLAPYAVQTFIGASGELQSVTPLEYLHKDPSGKGEQLTIIRGASDNEFSATGTVLIRQQLPNGTPESILRIDDCPTVAAVSGINMGTTPDQIKVALHGGYTNYIARINHAAITPDPVSGTFVSNICADFQRQMESSADICEDVVQCPVETTLVDNPRTTRAAEIPNEFEVITQSGAWTYLLKYAPSTYYPSIMGYYQHMNKGADGVYRSESTGATDADFGSFAGSFIKLAPQNCTNPIALYAGDYGPYGSTDIGFLALEILNDGTLRDIHTRFEYDPAPAVHDADGDGVIDETDNCPGRANPAQTDTNNDGIGDACQTVCDQYPGEGNPAALTGEFWSCTGTEIQGNYPFAYTRTDGSSLLSNQELTRDNDGNVIVKSGEAMRFIHSAIPGGQPLAAPNFVTAGGNSVSIKFNETKKLDGTSGSATFSGHPYNNPAETINFVFNESNVGQQQDFGIVLGGTLGVEGCDFEITVGPEGMPLPDAGTITVDAGTPGDAGIPFDAAVSLDAAAPADASVSDAAIAYSDAAGERDAGVNDAAVVPHEDASIPADAAVPYDAAVAYSDAGRDASVSDANVHYNDASVSDATVGHDVAGRDGGVQDARVIDDAGDERDATVADDATVPTPDAGTLLDASIQPAVDGAINNPDATATVDGNDKKPDSCNCAVTPDLPPSSLGLPVAFLALIRGLRRRMGKAVDK